MKFCGCLAVQTDSRDEQMKKNAKRYFLRRDLPTNIDGTSTMSLKSQKERTKRHTSMQIESINKTYASKSQSSSESIDKVVLRDSHHETSKRRSVTFANDSEAEQRKFLRLNKVKRGSIDELQLNGNKRAKSSPNVNDFTATINTSYETTTGDELDSSQAKKTVVRRRKRSKSPRKQLPSEVLEAIKFDLVESVGLDENQLKIIPYENNIVATNAHQHLVLLIPTAAPPTTMLLSLQPRRRAQRVKSGAALPRSANYGLRCQSEINKSSEPKEKNRKLIVK